MARNTRRGHEVRPCAAGSLSEFLLERYTAFTLANRTLRLFRVRHEPWDQTPVDVTLEDDSALVTSETWYAAAKHTGACYTPGVTGVHMGRPERAATQIGSFPLDRGWRCG